MSCDTPLKGWRARNVNPQTGKRSIVFQRSEGFVDQPVEVPCGQCTGCRLERSRQWAMRCVHEATMHKRNIFLTLTYDNEHLPESRSLEYRDFQLFMKRLLVHMDRKHNHHGIRFYMCGEYGEQFGRPHYHSITFNCDFPDKKPFKRERGNTLYTSETLTELWGLGHASIGGVTFQSAAYVSRYIMKKVTGDLAADHYEWMDPETGEFHERRPEFTNMSRRPGIGGKWFDKFKDDVFPNDFVLLNGKKLTPPRFYTNQYEVLYPHEVEVLKRARRKRAQLREGDNTPDRRRVKAEVRDARLKLLKRTIE